MMDSKQKSEEKLTAPAPAPDPERKPAGSAGPAPDDDLIGRQESRPAGLAQGEQPEPVKKRRGPKPGSKRQPKTAPDQEKVKQEIMYMGLAFDGLFQTLAVGLGEHWRTATPEDREKGRPSAQAGALAASWYPVSEYYDWQPGVSLLWVGAISTSIAIVVPKVQESVRTRRGLIGKVADWIQRKRQGRNPSSSPERRPIEFKEHKA